MSALSIQPTYPIFTDIDGQPLEDGYIWIGVANLAPIVNPITIYWDAALTIPAAQPVRTRGGYPINSGTPARLYVNSDYSIQVQNRNGSVVYSAPTATERYNGVVVNINAEDVIYDPPFSNATQTNVEAKLSETVSVKDFGAVGDKTADDTNAIQNAINSLGTNGGTVYFPPGQYLVTSTITVAAPIRLVGAGRGQILGPNDLTSAIYKGFNGNLIDFSPGSVYGGMADMGISNASTFTGDGILIRGGRVDFNRVSIFGQTGKGLVINDANGSTFSQIYTRFNGTGIYIDGVDANAMVFVGLDLAVSSKHHLHIFNGDSNSFFGVQSQGADEYGIYCESNDNVFYGVYSEYNVLGAVTFPGGNRNKVQFNVVLDIGTPNNSTGSNSWSVDPSIWTTLQLGVGTNAPVGQANVEGGNGAGLMLSGQSGSATNQYIDLNHSRGGGAFNYVSIRSASQVVLANGGSLSTYGRNTILNVPDAAGAIKLQHGSVDKVGLLATAFYPLVDNSINLGGASDRWKEVFAVAPVINTSDANEKQQIRSIDDAERAVAVRVKNLFQAFKFKDSVQSKGDDARIHFGVIAQEVQAAFAAEGLDASRYALFCSDTWREFNGRSVPPESLTADGKFVEEFLVKDGKQVTVEELKNEKGEIVLDGVEVQRIEHDTQEKTRLGIRYGELLAFVISAI